MLVPETPTWRARSLVLELGIPCTTLSISPLMTGASTNRSRFDTALWKKTQSANLCCMRAKSFMADRTLHRMPSAIALGPLNSTSVLACLMAQYSYNNPYY